MKQRGYTLTLASLSTSTFSTHWEWCWNKYVFILKGKECTWNCIYSWPAACVFVSKTCLVRHTSMKHALDVFVFIWSQTLAPWPVSVFGVSQVRVEFSPRGYDIRYWSSTVLIKVCVWESKRSVCRLLCWAGRQCVCLQSTQWPLSGLHSAPGALWLCFHCVVCMLNQGLGREDGSRSYYCELTRGDAVGSQGFLCFTSFSW